MKWRANDAGEIRRGRHLLADLSQAKIFHPLRRRCHRILRNVLHSGAALLLAPVEHTALYRLLEVHQLERALARYIFRLYLHHHSGVGELAAAARIGHPVENHGPRLGGRRHQYTAGAHAEREHAAAVDLLYKGVFGRRITGLPGAVVLMIVDFLLRMLYPHAQGETFGLQGAAARLQHLVNIPRRMPGGKNQALAAETASVGANGSNSFFRAFYAAHPCAEMILPTM